MYSSLIVVELPRSVEELRLAGNERPRPLVCIAAM